MWVEAFSVIISGSHHAGMISCSRPDTNSQCSRADDKIEIRIAQGMFGNAEWAAGWRKDRGLYAGRRSRSEAFADWRCDRTFKPDLIALD